MTEYNQNQREENRARAVLFRQLMNVPHRDVSPMVEAFAGAMADDPDFMARACAHLATGGSKVRDQVDVALVTLLSAPPEFPEYREAGRVLALGSDVYDTEPEGLPGLEPYRMLRVIGYLAGAGKCPRMRRAVFTDWVRFLEKNPARFDGVVMRNRKALKRAYVSHHLKPSPRAQAVLFDDRPPPDSKLAALKLIAATGDEVEKARLVVQHEIPYVVATSVLPKIGPEVGVALVGAMSPQEALNSRAWVERSGILNIEAVREVYLQKVATASASAATARHRKSAQGADSGVQAAVNEAAQKAVDESGEIDGAVLLLVDRSYSMSAAIQVAQEFGTRIAPMCHDRMVVAFNEYAREVEVDGDDLAAHERAFHGITANGNTSMQAGLDLALQKGFVPDKVVIVTDGGENRGSYAHRLAREAPDAHTVVIAVGHGCGDYRPSTFVKGIEDRGMRADLFEFTGDYYLFDQVVALLARPGTKPLVQQIMETALPRRKGWTPR